MNDIRPPRPSVSPAVQNETSSAPVPSAPEASGPVEQPKQPRAWRKKALLALLGVASIVAVVFVATWAWYQYQLRAVQASDQLVRISVVAGTNSSELAELLEQKGAIRSSAAFEWYVRLHRLGGSLQAGAYSVNKASPTPTIVDQLTSGRTDTFDITFFPGNTLAKHRKALLDAGFSETNVDAGLTASYNHPLLATKPTSADLEGYIYGETYQFPTDATVQQILTRTFDEMYAVVKSEGLVKKYKAEGLSLYEGITLASIVQREVIGDKDQQLVAGVFYNRLTEDMTLGSDVTYQYIADKTGVARDPSLDSPYNTRRYAGLPPGPIASPGKGALLAVGNPTPSKYLFFLSGDDDKTYFGRTVSEHEANIRNHCAKKCLIL